MQSRLYIITQYSVQVSIQYQQSSSTSSITRSSTTDKWQNKGSLRLAECRVRLLVSGLMRDLFAVYLPAPAAVAGVAAPGAPRPGEGSLGSHHSHGSRLAAARHTVASPPVHHLYRPPLSSRPLPRPGCRGGGGARPPLARRRISKI